MSDREKIGEYIVVQGIGFEHRLEGIAGGSRVHHDGALVVSMSGFDEVAHLRRYAAQEWRALEHGPLHSPRALDS